MSLLSLETYSKKLADAQKAEPTNELLAKFKNLEPVKQDELEVISASVLKAAEKKDPELKYPVTFFQVTKLRNEVDVNHAYVATRKLNVFRPTVPWFSYGFGTVRKEDQVSLIETKTMNMFRAEDVLTRMSEKQIKDIFAQLIIGIAAAHSVGVINIPPIFKIARTNQVEINISGHVVPTNGFIPIFTDFGPACIFENDRVVSIGTSCYDDTPLPDLKDEFNRFRNDFFKLLEVYRKKMILSKDEFPDPSMTAIDAVSFVPVPVPVPVPAAVPPIEEGLPAALVQNLITALNARVNVLSNWQAQFSAVDDVKYGHVRDCLAHVIERHEREIILLGDEHNFDNQVCKRKDTGLDSSGYHNSEYHEKIIGIIKDRLPSEAVYASYVTPPVIQSAEEYNILANRLWLMFKTRIYLSSARAIIILNKYNSLKLELCATIRKLDIKINEILDRLKEAHESKSMQINKDAFNEASVNFLFKTKSPVPIPDLVTDVIIHILQPVVPDGQEE